MTDIHWVRRGIVLIVLALAVALPISFFLPIFSGPLILVLSDAVLVGLSAVIAGLAPIASRALRLAACILVWMTLSLVMELPRLTETIQNALNATNQGTHPIGTVQGQGLPEQVSIVGPANPILSARGYWWQVVPDVHMVAVRESMGQPLINIATSIDLPDMLWARGIETRIGGSTYPRLNVSNVSGSESSRLRLEYLVAPGQVVATYDRKVPLPMREPGLDLDGASSLFLSILYANFWRNTLGLNRPVLLHREVSGFLDTAIGKRIRSDEMEGPSRMLQIEEEQVVQLPSDRSVSEFFAATDTSRVRSDDGQVRLEACGQRLTSIEFGRAGTRTLLSSLVRSDGSHVALLRSLSPDDRIFAVYCETASQTFVALSQLGTRLKPILRISTYGASGMLQSVEMFRLPRVLELDSFIVPGTWDRHGHGVVRFQMMERIRWVNDQHNLMEAQHAYRSMLMRAR